MNVWNVWNVLNVRQARLLLLLLLAPGGCGPTEFARGPTLARQDQDGTIAAEPDSGDAGSESLEPSVGATAKAVERKAEPTLLASPFLGTPAAGIWLSLPGSGMAYLAPDIKATDP